MLSKLKLLAIKYLSGGTIDRLARKGYTALAVFLVSTNIPVLLEFSSWLQTQIDPLALLTTGGVLALIEWLLSVKSDKKLEKETVIRVNQKLQ